MDALQSLSLSRVSVSVEPETPSVKGFNRAASPLARAGAALPSLPTYTFCETFQFFKISLVFSLHLYVSNSHSHAFENRLSSVHTTTDTAAPVSPSPATPLPHLADLQKRLAEQAEKYGTPKSR